VDDDLNQKTFFISSRLVYRVELDGMSMRTGSMEFPPLD
jgi:hypothetical protein